jgi:hypothetical protein
MIAIQETRCLASEDGQRWRREIICVFPAWPTEWDASFCLLARGGFLVSSEIQAGSWRILAGLAAS